MNRRIWLPLFTCLTVLAFAVPVSAHQPFRPLPNYRAQFVTQAGNGPTPDCLWASAQMYLDKLTSGTTRASHARLRALSGDLTGGSDFADVADAFRRLGVPFQFSPSGGDPLTWSALLHRLGRGGGAIILGDYSKLPRRYGRWDPKFWHVDNKADSDNHAMYIERYDARNGRVWLMDPLADTPGWKGEWIATRDLYRFIWKKGGLVYAAATPPAAADPFASLRLGAATVAISPDRLTVQWPVLKAALRSVAPPTLAVTTTRVTAVDPTLPVLVKPAPIVRPGEAPAVIPPSIDARPNGGDLQAEVGLPTEPGTYLVAGVLREPRWDHEIASFSPVVVYIPGARSAAMALTIVPSVVGLHLAGSVQNGLQALGVPPIIVGGAEIVPSRPARIVATWTSTTAKPVPSVDLGSLVLMGGERQDVDIELALPEAVGTWTLVIDVVDADGTSLATIGSAPFVITATVAPVDPYAAIVDRG